MAGHLGKSGTTQNGIEIAGTSPAMTVEQKSLPR
jgi:hypothetical protein